MNIGRSSVFACVSMICILVGCAGVNAGPGKCFYRDLRLADRGKAVVVLESCENGDFRILKTSVHSPKLVVLPPPPIEPLSLAVSRDARTLYTSGRTLDAKGKPTSVWVIARQELESPGSSTIIRQHASKVVALTAAPDGALAYMLQVGETLGRPWLDWYLDDFRSAPKRLTTERFGYILEADVINGEGLFFRAPSRDGTGSAKLVWQAFESSSRPVVAVSRASDRAYDMACSSDGGTCLEASTQEPISGTAYFQNSLLVHRKSAEDCLAPTSHEGISRLQISADGSLAAYIGHDLKEGVGGEPNARLVVMDLSGRTCASEILRLSLRAGG